MELDRLVVDPGRAGDLVIVIYLKGAPYLTLPIDPVLGFFKA